MRPLITTHFVSLDGVAEAPGGEEGYRHTGWTMDIEPDPASYERKGQEQEEATAFLMGGRSYDAFSEVWPTMDYFAGWNAMPKYVVSSTVTDPQWHNTTVLSSSTTSRRSRRPTAARSSCRAACCSPRACSRRASSTRCG